MTDDIANTAALNAAFSATLVDEWYQLGVRHAYISPGSRSAPMALALHRHGEIAVHVVLDERSAAFRALGTGAVDQVPAVLLCTSGTAAAHFSPAVHEAAHQGVPMLVCTADRPAELHDTGAAQTIDQSSLYGAALRWKADLGAPDSPRPEVWRSVAARAFAHSIGDEAGPSGPVHLNLAFREPLVAHDDAFDGTPLGTHGPRTVAARCELSHEELARFAELVRAHPRGLIAVGWGHDATEPAIVALSIATGWPILADAVANLRSNDRAVLTYEALVRDETLAAELTPQYVLRFGAPLTSKVTQRWLDTAPTVLIDPQRRWLDPARSTTVRLLCDGDWFATALAKELGDRGDADDSGWSARWRSVDSRARAAIDTTLHQRENLDGAIATRGLYENAVTPCDLLVASSMPVRDLEWFATNRAGIHVRANRGVNGIDGLISTAIGIATATRRRTYALIGDLAFLHDASALLGINELGLDLTIVVVDNNGGGIFSFLPQAELCADDEFEALFGTPQTVDLAAVATGYGVATRRVSTVDALVSAVSDATPGVQVIVAASADRRREVDLHREVWDSVRALRLAES